MLGACQPNNTPSTASKSITCIGDSITEGVGSTDPSKSYPAQLQELLGSKFRVNNLGSGCATMQDTPEAYKKSLQWKNGQAWEQFKHSDIFVILLGTNDSKSNYWNPLAYRAAYTDFIRAIKAQSPLATVVIAVPTTIAAEGACWGMKKQVMDEELPHIIAEIAQEEMLGLPIARTNVDLTADGCHPTDAGYAKLAQAVHTHLVQQNLL